MKRLLTYGIIWPIVLLVLATLFTALARVYIPVVWTCSGWVMRVLGW